MGVDMGVLWRMLASPRNAAGRFSESDSLIWASPNYSIKNLADDCRALLCSDIGWYMWNLVGMSAKCVTLADSDCHCTVLLRGRLGGIQDSKQQNFKLI